MDSIKQSIESNDYFCKTNKSKHSQALYLLFLEDIFKMANNKCHICQIECKIPYKKISKFYFCSKQCYHSN